MFWLILVVVVLLMVLIGGVLVANMASNRQIQSQKDKVKIRKLKQLAVDVEEVFETLRHYQVSIDLQKLVCNYLIGEIERRVQIDNTNVESIADLQRLKETYKELESSTTKGKVVPGNDRQIALMKRHLLKAIKLLKHMSVKSMISEMECQEHSQTLRYYMLRLEVDAYIVQGDKAKANQDNMSAGNYYKHAKEIMVASQVGFDGKTQEIKDISKLIAGLYTTVGSNVIDEDEEDEEEDEAEEKQT